MGSVKKGELLAVNFKFKERQVDADTSDFDLLSFDLDALAFRTTNVNAHVDFDTKKSEFKSNGGESFVEFPDNQYICYMDKFNWYMKNDDLEMEAAKKKGNEVKIAYRPVHAKTLTNDVQYFPPKERVY